MPPIPWTAILTHGPAIVAAAERLLASTGSNTFAEKTQGIEARLARLERASEESARLLQEIAQQIQAVAVAQEVTSQRARTALRLSAAAATLALFACVVAFVW